MRRGTRSCNNGTGNDCFNSIFFSHALDGRGSYAGAGGDEAARAAANHDVNGVREVEQATVDGLSTLLTTIVDYKGRRIVAQSIIPGILQGDPPPPPGEQYQCIVALSPDVGP